MAHNSEHIANAPIGEGLGHDVGHGGLVWSVFRERDIDAVVSNFDGVGGHAIAVALGRVSGGGVVVPAVPRAAQHAVLDRTLAERTALVGALVRKRCVLALEVRHAHSVHADALGLHAALGQLVQIESLVPNLLGIRGQWGVLSCSVCEDASAGIDGSIEEGVQSITLVPLRAPDEVRARENG